MRYLLFVLLFGGIVTAALAAGDGPSPPKDAMWTFNCRSFTGPYRVQLAKQALEGVKQLTGWKGWYIIHLEQEEESTLFFGYYRTCPLRDVEGGDPKEAEQAREDLRNIRALRDTDGNAVFPFVYPTEIPRPGSEGPPEYDLRNTPADRYWSLLVAEYRDNPERKKAAVDAVKILRKDNTEAYYLHGPTTSGVCVGAWPRSAIKEQESDVAVDRSDPNTIVKVYNFPLPKNAITDYYDMDGKHYRIFAPKVEILNASMQLAVDRNPYFAINGLVYSKRVRDRNKKEQVIPDPSLLLIIPHKGAAITDPRNSTGLSNSDAKDPAPTPPPPRPVVVPKPKDQPGTGKLRNLD
jgi:hypothetical protein